MIVVCGADNTGKSTLVKHLTEEFSLQQVPSFARTTGKMPHQDPEGWVKWQKEWMSSPNVHNLIFDRFYVDEFVYGPIMRGKVCIDNNMKLELDHLFTSICPMIILCETDYETMKKTFEDREQYPSFSQNLLVSAKFRDVLYTQMPFTGVLFKTICDYRYDPGYRIISKETKAYLNRGGCNYECERLHSTRDDA